jgi:hypothetical protein
MRCDEFLERATEAAARHVPLEDDLAAHLASCASCGGTLKDLEALGQAARSLPAPPLPPAAWHRIAARLSREPGFPHESGASGWHARLGPSWTWLAAAAAMVLLVGAFLLWMGRGWPGPGFAPGGGPGVGGAGTAAGSNGAPGDLVLSIEQELQLAAEHYEKAIAGLEQVASASDSPVDPEVMATMRRNLALIDGAIDESRQALKTQPESRVAQRSLLDAFRRKVELLQDTLALMNEMRKGNEVGAARIVEGLGKS